MNTLHDTISAHVPRETLDELTEQFSKPDCPVKLRYIFSNTIEQVLHYKDMTWTLQQNGTLRSEYDVMRLQRWGAGLQAVIDYIRQTKNIPNTLLTRL
ncbi:hypothetical protein COT72_04530 [archaeon CG10_big_fil_rev_8_21_14_0_10_43_11]|nr:MAG: hypothetical protein COT72_04530 [archaeon CG10_big_fil_rev_8_21_14_0_10_43_11]